MDAEKSLIGILINDGRAFADVRSLGIKADHFSNISCRIVWEAMTEVVEANAVIDIASVISRIPKQHEQEIISLVENCPVAQNLSHFANEVISASWCRNAAAVFSKLLTELSKRRPFESIEEFKTRISSTMFDLNSSCANSLACRDPNIIALDLCNEINLDESRAIRTGIKSFDNIYGGLIPPDLWVLGARPSVGKTTLSVNIAVNCAHNGFDTLFFTAEMRDSQILSKVVSRESRVPITKIRKCDMTSSESARFMGAVTEYTKSRLHINYAAAYKLESIEDETRRMHRLGKCKLVIVDYVQLIDAEGKWESRQKELSHITKRLKILANTLNIVIFACAQLNREADSSHFQPPGKPVKRKAPKLGNLKDSGSIEQDADNVVFLDRDDATGAYQLLFEKVRNGARGSYRIDANLAINLFTDKDYNHVARDEQ